jgi:hypothetical protein
MEILIITLALCALIGAAIGSSANKAGTGLILGLLFGPLGLIIIAILSMDSNRAADRPGMLTFKEFKKQLIREDAANRYLTYPEMDAKFREHVLKKRGMIATTAAGKSPKERLKSLNAMREELSEDEYQATRKRILAEL